MQSNSAARMLSSCVVSDLLFYKKLVERLLICFIFFCFDQFLARLQNTLNFNLTLLRRSRHEKLTFPDLALRTAIVS